MSIEEESLEFQNRTPDTDLAHLQFIKPPVTDYDLRNQGVTDY